jgi:hypothetical protein
MILIIIASASLSYTGSLLLFCYHLTKVIP